MNTNYKLDLDFINDRVLKIDIKDETLSINMTLGNIHNIEKITEEVSKLGYRISESKKTIVEVDEDEEIEAELIRIINDLFIEGYAVAVIFNAALNSSYNVIGILIQVMEFINDFSLKLADK